MKLLTIFLSIPLFLCQSSLANTEINVTHLTRATFDNEFNCAVLLAPLAQDLHADPGQASQNLIHYLQRFGLDGGERESDGLLDWMGIDLEKYPQIVLLSLNNFFGDSMIFHFSIVDYFRKRYPKIPLTIISPNAVILSRPEQLDFSWDVFPVRFPTFRKREDRVDQIILMRQRLPGFLKSRIQKGAFVFYDLTTCDKADEEMARIKPLEKRMSNEIRHIAHLLGLTAVGLSNLHEERIFMGVTGVELIAPEEKLPRTNSLAPYSADPAKWAGARGYELRGPVGFGAKTIYESWMQNFSLLFGARAYMHWDHRYFTNGSEDPDLIRKFLIENKLDPNRRHVLINLNTFGGDKVRDLTPIYFETLKEIVIHTREKDPDVNILVTFPETQFGPEVQVKVLDFARGYIGHLALISSSYRELMPAFVATSKWLVSYDSGLVHLASFLPADRVLTLALHSGGADLWRRPGQSYVKLGAQESGDELAARANRWIDAFSTTKGTVD